MRHSRVVAKPLKVLSKPEIKRLAAMLKGMYVLHGKSRAVDALGLHIQRPKTPPILSESIVTHLLRDRKILKKHKITGADRYSNPHPDIIANTAIKNLGIEIKGTGDSGFQSYRKKDAGADYLIWVYFGSSFAERKRSPIQLYILSKPKRHFNPKIVERISIAQFLKAKPVKFEFNLAEL